MNSNEKASEVILGIDLGTTNSEVALLYKGKPKLLKIDQSEMMPSVVSLAHNGSILVGQPAVNNELAAPTQTIRTIKRRMGQEEVCVIGENNFTPQMISSLILKRLKLAAETFLGHEVSKAVITVPAFFNERQREATKEAAELAGLEAVRLLNEPTAAALAYSLGKPKSECCLVYDLGGGTFDVSIVQISEGLMEVKASHGDAELGGSDFDRMIAENARRKFLSDYKIDLAKDPLTWARLMQAAEQAKIRLSAEPSAQILEEFIAADPTSGKALHLHFSISRTEFEALIRPVLEQTLVSVRLALQMAHTSADKLDRVILVGGVTYTPLVSEILTAELKIVPQAWLNPSLVVAMGAAIEAANLSGQSIGPMMVDITPHSLGTGCTDEYNYQFNHVLIRRNTPIPCTGSSIFYKMFDEQEAVEVKVYQGESSEISHNQFLGSFRLEELGEGRDICIVYTIDRSGLLHVTATDITSGKKASKTLKRISGNRVKHVNLADLSAVKVEAVEDKHFNDIEFDEDAVEFWNIPEEDDPSQKEEILVPFASISSEQSDLIAKSENLLAKGTLALSDAEQLNGELSLVKEGDEAAKARLADLIYYLG